MGSYHKTVWMSEDQGRSRKERRSGAYKYYIPTPLQELEVALDADVVGDVARAEREIALLNDTVSALRSSEGIARLLLRAEAVSSSHIEGLSVGIKRLLRAEANLSRSNFRHDELAAEVIGNIHAMQNALDAADIAEEITTDTILNIHKTLCAGTHIEKLGGAVRTTQNWVGGNSYNPLDADYIPPAPEHVKLLLADLAFFCNDDMISPVLQAALVHAQFESIHPFIDGNGRCGRALIHLILRRRGLTPQFVPPISLVLATHSKSYIEGLTDFRSDDEKPEESKHRLNNWVSFFSGTCIKACEEAQAFENAASQMERRWREQLGSIRAKSALDALLPQLAGMPLFTIKTAAASTGCAVSSITAAVERCLEAGIVVQSKAQKRNRVFEATEAIEQFSIFERRLASSPDNMRTDSPDHPVSVNLGKSR